MVETASSRLRVRDHAILAALVASGWGLVEGSRAAAPGAALVCAALLALAGAAFGVAQAGLLAALRALWRRARAGWPAPVDREHQLRVRALAIAGTLCGGLALAALLTAVRRLLDADDRALVAALVVCAAALLAAGVLFAAPVVAGLLLGPLRSFDRSVDLPLSDEPAVRRFLWALPLGLAADRLYRGHARALGPFALEFDVVWLVVAEVGALALVTLLPAGVRAWARARAGRGLAAALAIAALALAGADDDDRRLWSGVSQATGAGAVLRQLRRVSDVDGDGASSWLGGGDCAAWDPAIGPRARDEPGNRVDEDCDGADARARDRRGAPQLERFHGRLDPGLVRAYNVVWIIVDGVRADHTSLHGYRRATTPYLEHLAREALVFRQAYSQSSATMLSIPSMLAGRPVGAMTFDRAHRGLRARDAGEPLAAVLRRRGYRTGLVADNYVHGRLPGVVAGFESVANVARDGSGERLKKHQIAAATMTRAVEFLERAPGSTRPFFLVLYTADPHAPYVAHPEIPPFGRGDQARYDGEIAYSDRWIGFLLEYLAAKPGLAEDTVVVVTSDHGEEFNDHGGSLHARTCHEESTHVPLILRIPGVPPADVDLRVGLNDIAPTLVELLGLDVPADELDGQSLLLPALAPTRVPADRPVYCSVLSQRASQGDFLRHSVRVGRYALFEDALEGRLDLYDVEDDRRELRPLDPSDPRHRELTNQMAQILRAHLTGNLAERPLTR